MYMYTYMYILKIIGQKDTQKQKSPAHLPFVVVSTAATPR